MKIIAIICIISLAFGGITYVASMEFIEGSIISLNSAYELIRDVVGLPTAQRIDQNTTHETVTVSNPILNPNDSMLLPQYLEYVQGLINTDTTLITRSEVQDVFTHIEEKMYIVSGKARGTLVVPMDNYPAGTIVEYSYSIPCIKYHNNGITYLMLDPSVGNLRSYFEEYTPFTYRMLNSNFNEYLKGYSNTLIQEGGKLIPIRGNIARHPRIYDDGITYFVEYEPTWVISVKQVDVNIVDHINGTNRLDAYFSIINPFAI